VKNWDLDARQYIVIQIKDRTLQCLIDTGSVRSVISRNLVKQLRLNVLPLDSPCTLVAASGQNLRTIGRVEVNMQIKGLTMPSTFVVVEGLCTNLLLGTDFLSKNHAFINYKDHSVSFYDGLLISPLHAFNSISNCATIKQTACIAAYSEAIIPVQLPQTYRSEEVILEPLPFSPATVLVGSSLSSAHNGVAYLKVLNFKHHPVTLKKNTKIAKHFISPQRVVYF